MLSTNSIAYLDGLQHRAMGWSVHALIGCALFAAFWITGVLINRAIRHASVRTRPSIQDVLRLAGRVALGVMLVLFATLLVIAEGWVRGRARYHSVGSGTRRAAPTIALGRWTAPALAFCGLVAFLALGVPLFVLVWWMVQGVSGGEGLGRLPALIGNSFIAGGLAAVVTTAAALPVAVTPAPETDGGAAVRVAGDVLLFPALFKADKALWAGAWVFHAALWVILLAASVMVTFALYEIVRRVGILRFLFGMKDRRRVAPAETS